VKKKICCGSTREKRVGKERKKKTEWLMKGIKKLSSKPQGMEWYVTKRWDDC